MLLEPRRLAARSAARRIAWERGGEVGAEVGYEVRFDRQASQRTRILVVTEGILLRKLQEDPCLEGIGAILFDEFHERSLDADLALALVRKVQQEVRPDLQLVVMSASLDPGTVAQFLGQAPVVRSEGRLFPVEISYLRHADHGPIPDRVAREIPAVARSTVGDVLVFLPGVGEIHRTAGLLGDVARSERWAVIPLFGDLSPEDQDAALQPVRAPLIKKVILATNVAETSITIDGVTAVVDSGMARVMRYDPAVGLDRLVLERIARSSAEQRTGRAGRTAPGQCLRLWTTAEDSRLSDRLTPEIQRTDLGGAVLQLRGWGESDVTGFPWFEAPPTDAIERADRLLGQLGALIGLQVTPIGRQMVRIPAHPRLSRLLIAGQRLGCATRAALLAAFLAERDPFSRPRDGYRRRSANHVSRSDVVDRLDAIEEAARTRRWETDFGWLNDGAVHFLLRSQQQFLRLLSRFEGPANDADSSDEALRETLLAAFPDRLARRRDPNSPRGIMVGGKGVRLAEACAVTEGELFLCVDLEGGAARDGDLVVRWASTIERDWLPSEKLSESVDIEFDGQREKVTAVRRTRYEDLVLDEGPTQAPLGEATSAVLAREAAKQLSKALSTTGEDTASFIGRIRFLKEHAPELELPQFDDEEIVGMLPELCAGLRSFAELRALPLASILRGKLTPVQQQALDREAPARLTVPSGSKVALDYEPGRPPVLAARMQELFGWSETPRVARGRVPVLLHLLAPNMRPEQVTEDLASFWANVYPKIRKQLRQRYPKHSWPDDPLTAIAEKRPARKPK